MTPPMDTPSHRDHSDDEIDLLGLVRALLRTWKVWLISLVVVTGLYTSFHAAKIAVLAEEITYAKPIRLTFPGAHNLRFPNGSRFSFGDIIAPAIVQIAHERNNLAEYGMSASDLQASLSAEPYSPTYPIIIQQYNTLLAARNLTFEQAEELRQRMQAELAQASSGTVLIGMRLKKIQLPETVASKVLSDIPAIWAERTIRDKGVLNLDIQLVSAAALNRDLINEVEYIITGDLLDEKLGLLRENINLLSEVEGSSTIVDSVSGMRLIDLDHAIRDLSRYVIDELMSPIRFLGISRNPQLSLFYYEDRLKKLNMELELLLNQANLTRQAFNSYLQTERQISASTSGETRPGAGFSQMNADALDRLLQMSGDAQRETYKQELNDNWLKHNLKAAEVRSQIKLTETTVAALRATIENRLEGRTERAEAEQVYLNRINEMLPDILKRMDEYFAATERIYQQISLESVGVRDRLYTPLTNRVLTQKDGLNPKRIVLVWLALMFLTSAIVIPVTMIRYAMRSQPATPAD